MLKAGRSPARGPDEVDFFNVPNPSSRIMALGSIQPITKMSTKKVPGGKMRPESRADNLAAIFVMNVRKVGASIFRDPKGLHDLHRDNFTWPLPTTI
jgi:nitrous oxide reductase accessory protein NosL